MSLDAMKQALSAIEFADMYIKEIVTGSTNRIVAENLLRESRKSLRAAIEQPRQWQGLTEAEKVNVAIDCGCADVAWMDFADAIEAKLKEKNT